MEKGEAGQHGFAFINRKGEFAFEKQPDVPVRFFCAPQLASSDSAGIEELAEQIRLAGYNVVRPHFLDDFLMKGSTEDLAFNPKALDTWERYTAALKKRGIYLCMDATTSWSAYTTISAWDPKASAVRLKSRLYYDPKMRDHWEKGVRQLFEHVNPYTGVALKDEPQVMAVGLRNEPGFNFILAGVKAFDPDIVIPFRKWLKKNYATTADLRRAWGTSLKDDETLDTVALPSLKGKGPDTRDLQRYFTDAERETFLWGAKKLRDMGVRVPVYDYNIEGSIQSSIARDVMPFVDNHAYSDHPSGPWLQAGQQITQENPVGAGCSIIRWITSTRQWGRPLTCTEWGNPFWNQWRHEGAFTVAAYAAFQNWQFLGQHASPIAFSGRGSITPFQVASDPPAKANERMAAFLFVRGDVQPSTHKVEVKLDANTLFDQ
ncbi:MAG: beta-galactosidase, partial [Verrucomicrobiota bacterium]